MIRLGLNPRHESFSKSSMGSDGVLLTFMASLVISVVPGSWETLSDFMLNYLMNMQIMLLKTEFPIL